MHLVLGIVVEQLVEGLKFVEIPFVIDFEKAEDMLKGLFGNNVCPVSLISK